MSHSIWERILSNVAAAGNVLAGMVEALRTFLEGDPARRRDVAFSVAMIALSAKMAKADGVVSEGEVEAFRHIFRYPDSEARNVARLYNLARQDVAGFEAYAEKLARLCATCEENCTVLEDILDGLFHIATADGALHEKELAFLARVGEIFRLSQARFDSVMARHVEGTSDPYALLGVSRDDDFPTIKRRYRALVSEHHPDVLVARGLPSEMQRLAHDRMAAFNAAYEAIERDLKAA
ncbi:molecular chaperone DjlA [Xaviernesmea oryzae]|uniref:Molecular chaperone DjlA n=1 Tax=Xaviernesmea oryzae TaxID=464029 RepID=A0A1Q9AZX1_9HYPH|nr:DnaJ family molecular chaperone [Xaviernesmea oryzae]OLP61288.1 molecular chaperone DjlA [Xaviernesmea oryzae]SEL53838.1 DnaJ like chaperone protein [Xaviernesmea oryzae]